MTAIRLLILATTIASPGAASASDTDAVVITALRDPVAKSYRGMVAGMELFDQRRRLAPAADRLICVRETAALPPHVAAVDRASGSIAVSRPIRPRGPTAGPGPMPS